MCVIVIDAYHLLLQVLNPTTTVGTTTDRTTTVRADSDVDTDPEYVKSLSDGLVKGMLWNISVMCNQI